MDPVEAIGALREVYDDTERDLLFVYRLLQVFPESKVHIYYRKLLQEKLDMQAVTSAAADLFGAGQYGNCLLYTSCPPIPEERAVDPDRCLLH